MDGVHWRDIMDVIQWMGILRGSPGGFPGRGTVEGSSGDPLDGSSVPLRGSPEGGTQASVLDPTNIFAWASILDNHHCRHGPPTQTTIMAVYRPPSSITIIATHGLPPWTITMFRYGPPTNITTMAV